LTEKLELDSRTEVEVSVKQGLADSKEGGVHTEYRGWDWVNVDGISENFDDELCRKA
jgi:hypothetical protein